MYLAKFVKLLLHLLCICGLIYQTMLLLSQYLSGNTIVSLDIYRVYTDVAPAITLCFPSGISLNKLSTIDNNSMQLYKEYLDRISRRDPDLESIYLKLISMTSVFNPGKISKFINNLTWSQFIDRYTIDTDLVDFHFVGYVYNDSVETFHQDEERPTRWFNNTVTHSAVPYSPLAKCLTMFSSVNKQWRNVLTNIVKIIMKINLNLEPIYLDASFLLVSIHSPNSFPTLKELSVVKMRTNIVIDYSMTKTTLLDSRYNTDCINYNLDYKYENFNMRSDCIVSCVHEKSSCHGKLLIHFMIRRERLTQSNYYPTMEVCNNWLTHELYCNDKSKKDCTFRYYNYNIKSMYVKRNDTRFHIAHNTLPDISVTHLPEMTLISFICNLGGLFGIWNLKLIGNHWQDQAPGPL
jgi:hypothetical protein